MDRLESVVTRTWEWRFDPVPTQDGDPFPLFTLTAGPYNPNHTPGVLESSSVDVSPGFVPPSSSEFSLYRGHSRPPVSPWRSLLLSDPLGSSSVLVLDESLL